MFTNSIFNALMNAPHTGDRIIIEETARQLNILATVGFVLGTIAIFIAIGVIVSKIGKKYNW